MKVYLNSEGAIVQVVPSTIPRGSTVTDFEVEGPFSAVAISVRFTLRTGTTDPLLLTRVSAVSSPGLNVWSAKLPFVVTEYAGKVPYEIEVQDGEGYVIKSTRGTLTITPGEVPTTPDAPDADAWAQMIGCLNKIYDAVANGDGDTTELETAISELQNWVTDFEERRSITDSDTSTVYELIASTLHDRLKELIQNGQTAINGSAMGLMYVSEIPYLRIWASLLINDNMISGKSLQNEEILAVNGDKHIRFTTDEEMDPILEMLQAYTNGEITGGNTIWASTIYTDDMPGYSFTPSDLSGVSARDVRENDLVITADGGLYRIAVVYTDPATGGLLRAESVFVSSFKGQQSDKGDAGTGVTVIRETNYEVLETEGTVLATKLTPAEFLASATGGMELQVQSDDGVDWFVYQLHDYLSAGDIAYFSRQDGSVAHTISIEIAEDGTMSVGHISHQALGGSSIDTAALKTEIINAVYPVGAIYISYSSTSPATLFGGSWTQIQGRFLLASSGSYTAGSTGGEATHTLTTDEMPSHNHPTQFFSSDDTWKGSAKAAVMAAQWTRPTAYNATNVSTDATGGGSAHNNMPPYLAVYMWRRTA
ncbi:MAG: hypothetical protein IJX76_04900 [Clostridia bacterium]|nr:hypothetical protein [Clostridia bacterium]